MFSAFIVFDDDVLKAVHDDALTSPARMRRQMGIVARGPEAQAMIVALSQEPDKPDEPIQWTSPRQRRFVMAKLRRQGNLPYKRNHRQSQGWRVVLLSLGEDSGTIGVQNSSPITRYVQGDDQQGFLHKWPLARTVIRAHQEPLQNATINAWYRVVGVK